MHPSDVIEYLHELMEECRVEVHGRESGAGFFVAPGWVVTCAHVAVTDSCQVNVIWQGQEYVASLLASSAIPQQQSRRLSARLWPYPDLAVLQITDAPPEHPCVWLDRIFPRKRRPLTAAGFTDAYPTAQAVGSANEAPSSFRKYQEHLITLSCGGRTSISDGGRMIRLAEDVIHQGMSGGPVMNDDTGRICGVVKASDGIPKPGGIATPVDALRMLNPEVYVSLIRAHDRFHATDSRWGQLVDQLHEISGKEAKEQGSFRPDEERKVLGLLADLPGDHEHHEGMFTAVTEPGTSLTEYPLLHRRDVFTDLIGLPSPEDGPPPGLNYLVRLSRQAEANDSSLNGIPRRLSDQALLITGRMGANPPGRVGVAEVQKSFRPSVIARIRPTPENREFYRVQVWRYLSPGSIVTANEELGPFTLSQSFDLLKQSLPSQIDLLGGFSEEIMLELILPQEALDEDSSNWRLWEHELLDQPLGTQICLVVRPLERLELRTLHNTWRKRWQQLEQGSLSEDLVCVCGQGEQSKAALAASLARAPKISALVLNGSPCTAPTTNAYLAALTSGVPVMLWERGSSVKNHANHCRVPCENPCQEGHFLSRVRKELNGTSRDEVPQRVLDLRLAAQTNSDIQHVGKNIVVMWDDPDRQIQQSPLEYPKEGPHG